MIVDGPPRRIDPLIRHSAGPNLFPRLTRGTTVFLDDADARVSVAGLLSELGHDCIEAEDGNAALAILDERADIDVLLTDAVAGRDLARTARPRRPGLAVVFTSDSPDGGHGDPSPDDDGPVIARPYRKSELAEKLAAALDMPTRA